MGWGGRVGTLEPGAEADLIAIDPAATPLLKRRTRTLQNGGSIEELLFALLVLGDDRAVRETYLAGRACKSAARKLPESE